MKSMFNPHLVWLSIIMASPMALATPAIAQEQVKQFDIPAQPLSSAILEFSRQSDVLVIVAPDLTVGKVSQPLKGSMSVSEAIGRLLDGSHLQAVPTPTGGYRIDRSDRTSSTASMGSSSMGETDARSAPAEAHASGAVEKEVSAELGRGSSGLEEIIVSAQRRDARLLDVPVSVTALSARALEANQITNVGDLSAIVPNLTATGTPTGHNDILLSLRGLSLVSVNDNIDPTVGVYIDGVYYARTQGTNVALIDLERVEVLRGPQGTLFGRNTIGGALNVTTQKPTFDDFSGSLKIGHGNYDALHETVMLNIPIVTGKWAARLVYDHQSHDGYAKTTNPLAGARDFDDQNQDYVRASLRGELSDSLEVNLYYDRFWSSNHGEAWMVNYFDPAVAATVSAANRPSILAIGNYLCPECRSNQSNFNPLNTGLVHDYAGTATWEIGGATLKSITAYRDIDFDAFNDLDGSPLQYAQVESASIQNQFSQELQAFGKSLNNRLDWIAGLYYFQEVIDKNANLSTSPTTLSTYTIQDAKNRSQSAFGQLSYEFLPNVRATAGVRYVRDTRTITYNQLRTVLATGVTTCALPPGLTPPPGPACIYTPPELGFRYMPWTAGVDYKPAKNVLVYTMVSEGYRSGGFQSAGTANAVGYTPFGAENVLSVEAGAKLSLLQDRLFLNGAVYDSSYNKIQQNVVVVPPGSTTPVPYLANIGDARIKGAEFEATALLGEMRVNASIGLIDPKYTSGPYVGTDFVMVSKENWSLSGDYPIPLSLGTLNLHADNVWQSARYFYPPINTSVTPFRPITEGQRESIRQSAYGLLNARVSLALEPSNITVSVWARNVLNEFYVARAFSFYSQGFNTYNPGDPRTYGVTVGYEF